MLLLSIFLERPLNIGSHHGFPPFEEGLELGSLPDSLKEGDVGNSSWLVTSDGLGQHCRSSRLDRTGCILDQVEFLKLSWNLGISRG